MFGAFGSVRKRSEAFGSIRKCSDGSAGGPEAVAVARVAVVRKPSVLASFWALHVSKNGDSHEDEALNKPRNCRHFWVTVDSKVLTVTRTRLCGLRHPCNCRHFSSLVWCCGLRHECCRHSRTGSSEDEACGAGHPCNCRYFWSSHTRLFEGAQKNGFVNHAVLFHRNGFVSRAILFEVIERS